MPKLHYDPNWPRAKAWLEGDHDERFEQTLAVLGVPMNSSITPGRCDMAPGAIRVALERYSPYDVDADLDLRRVWVTDYGNVTVTTPAGSKNEIANAVRGALEKNEKLVIFGGDNGITRPGVHGIHENLEAVGLLTLDAHFDLRDLGQGLSNGNPVRTLLADGLPGENIHQIGIQSFANSMAYADIARQEGIRFVTTDEIERRGLDEVLEESLSFLTERVDVIYFDLDVDVLDRAFSPGTPGSRPGGLLPSEVKRAAKRCGRHPKVKVMDLVEVDPSKDVADITVLNAASFLLSFAAGLMLSEPT